MTADWLRRTPIAHRGLHGTGVPENSLAAFEAAVEAGVAIELDVRASADGEPVVFHDPALGRMTGAQGCLGERMMVELHGLRLAGTSEWIPTLRAALEHVGGRTPVLIEVKSCSRAIERQTARVLSDSTGDFAVQSFDPLAVRRLKRLLPGVPCGLLAGPSPDLTTARRCVTERLLLAPWVGPDFIAYDVRGPCGWARGVASMLRVPLIVWTVRSATERSAALALGANVIFESD